MNEIKQQWQKMVAKVNEAIGLEWIPSDKLLHGGKKDIPDFTHAHTGVPLSWRDALDHAQDGTTPPPF